MLEHADRFDPDHVEGRFVIHATHRSGAWKVIVEPDFEDRLLVVVTAYRVG